MKREKTLTKLPNEYFLIDDAKEPRKCTHDDPIETSCFGVPPTMPCKRMELMKLRNDIRQDIVYKLQRPELQMVSSINMILVLITAIVTAQENNPRIAVTVKWMQEASLGS